MSNESGYVLADRRTLGILGPAHYPPGTKRCTWKEKQKDWNQGPRCGERHGKAKLTEDNVRQIRSISDKSHGELAEMFGVSKSHIINIRARRLWKRVN